MEKKREKHPMNALFALNTAAHLAVVIIAVIGLMHLFSRGKMFRTISGVLATIGTGHLLLGLMQLFWILGMLEPNETDLILLLLATTVMSSALFLYVSYKLTKSRHLIYVFLLYMMALVGAPFSMDAFVFLALGISCLVMLIAFSELLFFRNALIRRAGILGIASTFVMISFFILLANGVGPFSLPWLIPTALIAGSMHYLFRDMREFGVQADAPRTVHHPAIHVAAIFLKFIIFVFSLVAFTFLSVVALHEFGHAIVGEYYGCEKHTAIIYDITHKARTELLCSGPHSLFLITIAGFAITVLLGVVFLIVGDNFTYRLSTLILGYSLLVSYGDFADLGLSLNLNAMLAILATLIVMLSIIRLSSFYLRHYHLFDEDLKKNMQKVAKGEAQVERIAAYDDEAKNIKPLAGSKKGKKAL